MKDRPQKNKAGRSIGRQLVMIALCLMIFGSKYAHAEPLTGLEYNVKAGFIYNFAKFVEWPPAAFEDSNAIGLCFVSDDPSSDVLFKLNDKTVSGKKIKVKKCEDDDSAEGCNIFFFGTTDKSFIKERLTELKNRSVLTVGEIEGFAQMGGIINFFVEQKRLRFEVNVDAARKAGLKLSSQILMSAEIVKGGPE
jgi:YfiR/HmsC-like